MAQTVEPAAAAETAVVDRERNVFATIIVAGHAIKHMLTSGLTSVLIPEIKRRLNLSDAQVGSLGSVQQFTGWLATMTGGYLGDRFTRNTNLMLALSLSFTGSALLLLSFAPSYAVLLLGMLLMGFGPSMFHPPAVGALSRRFPERRSFAISLHGTGGSIGEMTGPLVAAGALALLYWRDELKLGFVVAILTALILWRLLHDGGDTDHGHDHAPPVSPLAYAMSFFALLANKPLRMIFLVTAFRSVGQATTAIFLPIYLRDHLGYSSFLVGAYIAMGQAAGVGSQPLMGHLSDRFGHKAIILPAMLAFCVLLGLLPLADGKLQLAIVILALGAFVFSMQSILTSAAVELAGEGVFSTATSLVYAASFLGSLAPTVAGLLSDAYGIRSTFYFSCSLAAVGTLLIAMTHLPPRVHETPAATTDA